jgi:hypothetical protein
MKMKFEAPVNLDDGYRNTRLTDKANHEMIFRPSDDGVEGFIEWIVEFTDGRQYVEGIGLWFDSKELVDYDGVFEIPTQALDLLESLGYNVNDYRE